MRRYGYRPKKARFFLFIVMGFCFLFMSSSKVFSWDSVGYDNHRHIADDAAQSLQYGYPDVYKYLGGWWDGLIMDGSGTEGSHTDPYSNVETWADGKDDWLLKARGEYLSQDIKNAYNHLGYAIHLAQDIFVPAHKNVIYHGLLALDDFESYANNNHGYSSGSTPWTFTLPYGNHEQRGYWLTDAEDDDDGDDTAVDVNDATTPDGPNAYQITRTWGSYGNGSIDDYLPGNVNGTSSGDYFSNSPALTIVTEQLQHALDATLEEMRNFSLSLPPLTKDFSLSSQVIDSTSGTTMNFSVLENRMQDVYVSIEVKETGDSIKTDDGVIWNNAVQYLTAYTTPGDTTHLPWEGTFSRVWKGAVASGACLNGSYNLELSVTDHDGKVSQAATVPFSISMPVSITHSLYPGGTIFYPGDVVSFTVNETNNSGCNVAFYAQPYVVKPDGPVVFLEQVPTGMNAGETRTHAHTLALPLGVEIGSFRYGVLLTDTYGNLVDHDTFDFTVISAAL